MQSNETDGATMAYEIKTEAVKVLEPGRGRINSKLELENRSVETIREWSQKTIIKIDPFKEALLNHRLKIYRNGNKNTS